MPHGRAGVLIEVYVALSSNGLRRDLWVIPNSKATLRNLPSSLPAPLHELNKFRNHSSFIITYYSVAR